MLTREQISTFAALAPTLAHGTCDNDIPAFFLTKDLVQVGRGDRWELTPRGHDLLATVPHLPAIEPEAPAPSCSRCGGSGEVPLFMGPMSGGGTMPCSVCKPAKPRDWSSMSCADVLDEVEKVHASITAGSVPISVAADAMHRHWADAMSVPVSFLHDPLMGAAPTWRDPGYQYQQRPINLNYVSVGPSPTSGPGPADDRPVGEGWVRIDSASKANAFVGARAWVWAPGSADCKSHPLHACTARVTAADFTVLTVGDDGHGLAWESRGNVYLRLVAE
jgi:hypothetical protein